MKDSVTPIRRQYLRVKEKYPGAIVLFRLGDFYETFDEDARTVAAELEIVLTSREMGKGRRVPMAGIPYHALDGYLARLVNHGHKVAICEQITEPGATRGLVEREVIRVVTPGTVVEPGLLDSRRNNYLASLVIGDREAGIAYIDITTSEFTTTQLPVEKAVAELARIHPAEIVAATSADLAGWDLPTPVTRLDDFAFDLDTATRALLEHFAAATLDGFGCAAKPLAVIAAGAILVYIRDTQKTALAQITRLSTYSTDSFMALDEQTVTNLEVFRNARTASTEGSLLGVIDQTKTAMGSRRLRQWLGRPLLDLPSLVQRQEAIAWAVDRSLIRSQVLALLAKMADLERLVNRVGSGIALPRELVALRRSLEIVPPLVETLAGAAPPAWLVEGLKPCPEVVALIAAAIADEPASSTGEGNVIRPGFSEEMDRLRGAAHDARQFLAGLERQEQQKTGIKSLKVGYNKVFGYYLEVSNANLPQVPDYYIRKQTLVGGERFYTPELKEYESLILNARDRIQELESELFQQVSRQVAGYGEGILGLARALANLDVVIALAEVAARHGYVRPQLDGGSVIEIKEGRHPVVERALSGSAFVPNDVCLANEDAQIVSLTGPNMAGKSTYLKQVALIVLLAQTGSFVPAASARIGLVDRIFTRIGAREDIAAGQSTFMVEMIETAGILNNATPRSLLILDEIGRGTSTYDGLSIARAVAEYIHNNPRLGAKTLFATHYHELVELAGYLPRVRNFNVAVAEEKGEVVFLRKIVPGGVDKSYGIHVARLAGLPRPVVQRAHEVLQDLEGDSARPRRGGGRRSPEAAVPQLPLFAPQSAVVEELAKIDINSLTPLEALTRLYELQQKAKKEK